MPSGRGGRGEGMIVGEGRSLSLSEALGLGRNPTVSRGTTLRCPLGHQIRLEVNVIANVRVEAKGIHRHSPGAPPGPVELMSFT
jgi:hypothetical protein